MFSLMVSEVSAPSLPVLATITLEFLTDWLEAEMLKPWAHVHDNVHLSAKGLLSEVNLSDQSAATLTHDTLTLFCSIAENDGGKSICSSNLQKPIMSVDQHGVDFDGTNHSSTETNSLLWTLLWVLSGFSPYSLSPLSTLSIHFPHTSLTCSRTLSP